MHTLEFPTQDSIQLLIGGITQNFLKATALSISTESLNSFLEKMRHITQGVTEYERKPWNSNSTTKGKDNGSCRNCGKKGHNHKQCPAERSCFYCKEKGHCTYDCPSLKKKQKETTSKSQPTAARVALSVTEEQGIGNLPGTKVGVKQSIYKNK